MIHRRKSDALGGGHAEIVAWILILVTSIIVILDDAQKKIYREGALIDCHAL